MNKTKVSFKCGIIKEVINELKEKGGFEKLIRKLEGKKEVDKAYVTANRYARKYIHNGKKDKRDRFINNAKKLEEKWISNGNKWIEDDYKKVEMITVCDIKSNEIIKESDNEFIRKIEESEKGIIVKEKEKIDSMILKTIFGDIAIKLKKEFLEKIDIDKELICYKNGVEVYYSKSVNGLFEVI